MNNNDNLGAVQEKISKFSDKYRSTAEKLHNLIMEANSSLQPRLWYGMPGYAKTQDGPVILFFREDKYVTFGLTENAGISVEGEMVECSWFLTDIRDEIEKKILYYFTSKVVV